MLLWYATQDFNFRVQDYHLLWFDFPDNSAKQQFCNFPTARYCSPTSTRNLRTATDIAFNTVRIWAISVSLATTQEIAIAFFSLGYLDVSVLPVRFPALFYSDWNVEAFPSTGSPIQKSPDQSLLATPRSLSQLTTSFIAF